MLIMIINLLLYVNSKNYTEKDILASYLHEALP